MEIIMVLICVMAVIGFPFAMTSKPSARRRRHRGGFWMTARRLHSEHHSHDRGRR